MGKRDERKYSDFSNVTNLRDDLIPEEYPEGSYGSPIGAEDPVYGKSTPWKKGQRRQSAFTYSYKELHEDLPRQAPGAHPLHDEPDDVNPEQEEQ